MAWDADFVRRMDGFALPAWEALPDLGLYMDQVITYLERVYRPLYGEGQRIVTPAMINNYVKSGLVARPAGKKYDRPQLAQLLILCGLKQALSLDNLRHLMASQGDAEQAYRAFRAELDAARGDFAQGLGTLSPMRAAVLGASYTLLCEEMLRRREG